MAEQLDDDEDDGDASGFTPVDIETVARAIDSAAAVEDQDHFDLPSEAMALLGDEVVPAMLRKLVSNTFFRYLRLEISDPTRVSVAPNGDFSDAVPESSARVERGGR